MMDDQIIYLDHAAATPLDKRVLKAMSPYFSKEFFNPSSPYKQAVKVRRAYEAAKQTIALSMGAKAGEIIITAGATESINMAFAASRGHVVTSNIEHQSILACAAEHNHTLIKVDENGIISAESVRLAIEPDTQLVSIGLANNELGTIQPIRDIAEIIKKERKARLARLDSTPIYFHCDASQGAGLLDINVARLGVDMLTLNAGKIYGPKQIGLLWASNDVRIKPLILGGGQEYGLRSGTENIAGVVGFAKAIEIASKHHKGEAERLAKLRDNMQSLLTEAFSRSIVSGHKKHRLANYLHVSFPGLDGERLVFLLENRGVLVATGSACAANKGTRSHVLKAIGLTDEEADGSIRISLGRLSDAENTKMAARIIIEEVKCEYKRVGI
jgi:cysteine desulfurase